MVQLQLIEMTRDMTFFNDSISDVRFNERWWKKAHFAGTSMCSLIPTIITFLVHPNDVTELQFQFKFTVRWIRHNASESVNEKSWMFVPYEPWCGNYFSLCTLLCLFLVAAPDANAAGFGPICAEIVTASKLCDLRWWDDDDELVADEWCAEFLLYCWPWCDRWWATFEWPTLGSFRCRFDSKLLRILDQ